MEKRHLGRTGVELSLIGQGGFHLVELTSKDAEKVLNTYIDLGGNYIETAAQYGDGNSEAKIGRSVSHRRSEYFLATKVLERNPEKAEKDFERSLKLLKTDYVDICFVHSVVSPEDVDACLADDGVFPFILEAQKAGRVRYIGISGHGQQDAILHGIRNYPFDLVMTGVNFYDRFNYPDTEEIIFPECIERGIGIVGMKALADGYLYRSVEQGIRYSLSRPVSTLVLGMNTVDMVKTDMDIGENFSPMTEEEEENLVKNAVELGDYVCRQCSSCTKNGFKPSEYFLLEGLCDRQMDDRRLKGTPDYALRERLRFWFAQEERAEKAYARLEVNIDPERDYSELNKLCPYGIDIDRKLKITHDKLGSDGYIY